MNIMSQYKFENFLSSDSEYQESEDFWGMLLEDAFNQNDTTKEWLIQYGAKLGNGSYLRDGNPMLSAYSESNNKFLRVVQLDPRTSEQDFIAWVKYDKEDDVIELTISSVIDTASEEKARFLLNNYVDDDCTFEKISTLINEVENQ